MIGCNYQKLIVFGTNSLSLAIEMKVSKVKATNFHLLLPPQPSREKTAQTLDKQGAPERERTRLRRRRLVDQKGNTK